MMRYERVLYRLLVVILGMLASAPLALGDAMGRPGADPHVKHLASDWPAGLDEVFRHPSRVYVFHFNMHESAYFHANAEQVNELIKFFSETRLRDHEISIVEGSPTTGAMERTPIPYNVRTSVISGLDLPKYVEREDARTYEPMLVIHLDPELGGVSWAELRFPDNVIVTNHIASIPLQSKKSLPKRKMWNALLRFDDGSIAHDARENLYTKITLWEKGVKEPIHLGSVNTKGYFRAAFSDEEMAELKAGNSWLTMTVGEWSIPAGPSDPRLGWDKLTLDPKKAVPVVVSEPRIYHGRLLYEDGSPVYPDSEPWVDAAVRVEFPYVGRVSINYQGYFEVLFTKARLEELVKMKPRENIYIPTGKKGEAVAKFTYPASELSRDKDKAGVVKIPNKVKKTAEQQGHTD